MKYPIGIQTFEQIIDNGFVYVDKTDLVYKLATEGKIYFLSRPRRFGKSSLLSTLKCYFEGRKELFKGLKIDALETEWKQHPIFHIDFNGTDFSAGGGLDKVLDYYLNLWERQWEVAGMSHEERGIRFANVLHQAHVKTGQLAVVLIDEYDKPLLDVLDTGLKIKSGENDVLIEDYNRNVLKAFYSVFKLADADLRFVMLTGVTKFSQVSVFSGFNQPDDISMSVDYETLCGITKEELTSVFAGPIHEMAEAYQVNATEMMEMLRQQYDGYHFSSKMTDIFNPFSLLNAFKNQSMDSYWFRSGTPTYLIRLLRHTNENLNELTGKYYSPQQFIDYKADVEKPLPMIYQSGYLTIKGIRRIGLRMGYLLDFPNAEVAEGFLTLVANNYLQPKEDSTSWLFETADALSNGDLKTFERALTAFLASIPYSARRHENEREKERYFQYTVYLLMRMIGRYTVYHEKETSEGRADCVVETSDYVYIFEYKLDRSADEAIAQIDAMGYAREYANDHRKIYKIACCFSSKTGTVSDFKVVGS